MHSINQELLQNQRGLNRLGVLLFVLIIAALVFVGSQVFPFFYYASELEGMMDAQARKATVFSDQEIREFLRHEIKRLEIPIEKETDLKINRTNNKIIIELEYEEVLYIDLGEDRSYDLYVFKFNPHVEHPL
jgi:hypothetical protein